jgi:uncharacterized repeat protein (TIGR01451 family)
MLRTALIRQEWGADPRQGRYWARFGRTEGVHQASNPHTTTRASLPDGIGYCFHLRTCDAAGHCATALHRGPYWIDQTSPAAPTALTSASHTLGLPSSDRTIDISWTASLDPLSGGVASGIDGYSVLFDAAAASACTFTKTVEETTLSTTSDSLAAGTWYAHVCAVDNAGNWSVLSTAGPFVVETEADLSITKTDGQESAAPGQSVVYTMVVTNGGTIPVVGATVTDSFPWTCVTVS